MNNLKITLGALVALTAFANMAIEYLVRANNYITGKELAIQELVSILFLLIGLYIFFKYLKKKDSAQK